MNHDTMIGMILLAMGIPMFLIAGLIVRFFVFSVLVKFLLRFFGVRL